ncbi:MAG: ABC transporter permease [Promethearchaeota archaeon]
MVNDEVEEEIDSIIFLIESVKKKKKGTSSQEANGTLSFDTSEFWPRFRRHKLGMIGFSIFLIMIFFALMADIFAPYPWEYRGMDKDNGPTPYDTLITSNVDTSIFQYLHSSRNPLYYGASAPDLTHAAIESTMAVPEDLHHARRIYAACPFTVRPFGIFNHSVLDYSVTLSIDEAKSTGLTDGGFMVEVAVERGKETETVAYWTAVNHNPVDLSDYLGTTNIVHLNILDISEDPIKIVVNWSLTWYEGPFQRHIEVNHTNFLIYISQVYNFRGWSYISHDVITISDFIELQYGLPPPSPGENGSLHLLGTDHLGHDILAGLIYGVRVTFFVSFIAIAISTAIGIGLGILLDKLGISSLEFFRNLPQPYLLRLRVIFLFLVRLNLLIILFSFLQSMIHASDAWGVLIILAIGYGITDWGGMTLVIQNQLLSSKEQFISREKTLRVLPAIAFGIVEVIFLDTCICFLGLGHPETPAWGRMLQLSQVGLRYAWWSAVFPGLAIVFALLGFILLGYGLRETLGQQRDKEIDLAPTI